jgi:hypothetical protein
MIKILKPWGHITAIAEHHAYVGDNDFPIGQVWIRREHGASSMWVFATSLNLEGFTPLRWNEIPGVRTAEEAKAYVETMIRMEG